jgi:hypothetical protein
VVALAALDTQAGLLIALATGTGVLCSHDGGRTFNAVLGIPDHAHWVDRIALTLSSDGGPRLSVSARAAGVWVSDDFGATFRRAQGESEGLNLAADSERGLVLLSRDQTGLTGRAAGLDRTNLWSCRELIVWARTKPVPQVLFRRCDRPEASWQTLPQAAPPAALVVEGDSVSVYFISSANPRRRVLRRQLLPLMSCDQVVSELPSDAGAPLRLAGSHTDGLTTLLLSAERSVYRLVFRVGGSRHAS